MKLIQKIALVLLLSMLALVFVTVVNAQSTVRRHATHYSGEGDPSGNDVSKFPSLSLNCSYINRATGKVFRYTNTGTTKWVADSLIYPNKGQKGDKGDKGDTVIGPQGEKGDPGVCPPCPGGGSGSFPFIIVIANGSDDRTQLQAAINQNAIDNREIYTMGSIKLSGSVTVNKNNYRLTMNNYSATWSSTNSNAFTWIQRTKPTDNSDANIYIVAQFVIKGGKYYGKTTQNGFDLGPSYMSVYSDMEFDSFNEIIHLRFALNTTVENIEAVNCLNPFIADIGNWTGASNSNSQSNHTSFTHCRVYAPNGAGNAFYIFAASGCSVRDCIVEGGSVTNGIFFDSNNSSVVRDATIENVHFECVNGASNAFIKLNYGAGTITINKAYGQYSALFLDVTSATNFTIVDISNVPWFVLKNGKFIKRQGDVTLKLDNIIVAGPTIITGANVMNYIDNSGTNYRTPYYFEDPTGKLKINNQR